jgi:hypothetical protein
MVILKTCGRFVAALFLAPLACGNGQLDAFESLDGGGEQSGLIDDFEDTNNHSAYGLGWWWMINDHSGTQTFEFKAPSDSPGNHGALHSTGSGFSVWGAEVGVTFDTPYDARRFWGVEFSAESGASGTITDMTLWLLDANHSFGYPTPLTSTWQTYRVPFAEAVASSDASLRLDASHINTVQFLFDAGTGVFDLWLDNVKFVTEP